MMQTKTGLRFTAGIGIAMVALIDSTVSVTTRQSDSVPIASEVAMALASREEATVRGAADKAGRAGRPHHVLILQDAGESPAISAGTSRNVRRQHCGDRSVENGGITAKVNVMPAIVNFWRHARANVRQLDCRSAAVMPRRSMPPGRRPRPAASPWRRNPGSARPAAARRGSRGRSPDRSRSGRRHGCSRRARCRRP